MGAVAGRIDHGNHQTMYDGMQSDMEHDHDHGYDHEEHEDHQTASNQHRDHGGGGGGGEHHMSMSMFFHAGYTETVLFKFWRTDSSLSIVLSCLVLFLVAVFYEALKFTREWLYERQRIRLEAGRETSTPQEGRNDDSSPQQVPSEVYVHSTRSSSLPPMSRAIPSLHPHRTHIYRPPRTVVHIRPEQGSAAAAPFRHVWCSGMHILQTFLHVLQVFISFLLMLVFMTFNVWLCLAVLLGAGVGYYVFCAFSTRIHEHCN